MRTSFRPNILFPLLSSVLFGIGFGASTARADVEWIKDASDCASFEDGLTNFWSELGELSAITPEQKGELRTVLSAACGEKFSHCAFSICKGKKPTTTASVDSEKKEAPEAKLPVKTEPLPQKSEPAVAPSTEGAAAKGPVEHKDKWYTIVETAPNGQKEKSKVKVSVGSPIITDPLAWLDQPMDCEDFLDQMAARYSMLGPISKLPPAKQTEINRVLDIACSERFSHCGIKSCVNRESRKSARPSAGTEVTQAPTPDSHAPESGSVATIESKKESLAGEEQADYEALVLQRKVARDALIKASKTAEQEKNLTWVQFKMPAEEQSEAEPEEESEKTGGYMVDPKKIVSKRDYARRRSLKKRADSTERSTAESWPLPSRSNRNE